VLDVIPLDVIRSFLGIPYNLYDRDDIYHRREIMYQIMKYYKKFVVKDHQTKHKAPNIIMGDKSMVNASRKLALMEIKHQVRGECNWNIVVKLTMKKINHHKKKGSRLGVQGCMEPHSSFVPIGGSQLIVVHVERVVS